MKVKLGTVIESVQSQAYSALIENNSFLSSDVRFSLRKVTKEIEENLTYYNQEISDIKSKYKDLNNNKLEQISFMQEKEKLINVEVVLSFEPFDEKYFLLPENKLTTSQMIILDWMTKKEEQKNEEINPEK